MSVKLPLTRYVSIARLILLSLVMRYILDGWPGNANECAEPAQPYFTYREELSIVDGLLVKSNRIVIPTDMRHDCLETLHAPHLGLQKTLLRAHTSVFWPGMTADIQTQISNCSACQVSDKTAGRDT